MVMWEAPATIALLVGPWQLLSGLRRSHLHYHRVSGGVYLLAIGVSSCASLYLGLAATEPHWTVRFPLGVLSVAWMVTTGMAYVAIRNRRFEQHKEWMIRSYVLTFAFVVTRLAREFPSLWLLGTEEQVATTVNWVCWTIPLFVAEALFQKSKVQRPAPKGAA